MGTNELISEVLGSLDYTLCTEDRVKLVEKIENEYGAAINEMYTTYFIENSDTYSNRGTVKQIDNMYEMLTKYILEGDLKHETEEQKQNRQEYPYEVELSSGNGSTGEFLDLEDFVNSLRSVDNQDESVHYTTRSDVKIDVKYVKDNIDNCPPIQSHLDYANRVMGVIRVLDAEYNHRLQNDLPLDGRCLLWVNHNTGIKYWFSPLELFRLKRSVGYRGHNCVEIDKEVIYMYDNWYQPIPVSSSPQTFEISQRIEIDFSDEEQVRGLLLNSALTGWSPRFDRYVRELDRLVEKVGLTEVESKVYRLLRNGKTDINDDSNMFAYRYTQTEIAKIIGISLPAVSQTTGRIVQKSVKQHIKEYEDWYYTFIEKGKYKKCSKCGKNKIQSELNFYKGEGVGGFRADCKKCGKSGKSS